LVERENVKVFTMLLFAAAGLEGGDGEVDLVLAEHEALENSPEMRIRFLILLLSLFMPLLHNP